MSINKKEIFKTVPIKGKGKGTIDVCNYDNSIIIQPNDKNAASKVNACYDKKPKVHNVLVGVDTLQAPDNDWMVTEDTSYYKVPDNQNGTVTKQADKALGRISRVKANLVFVRYQGTLRKMLKMDKNAPYNYIDASAAIPYYQYILKNRAQYQIDPKGYETLAWAEGVDKKVKGGQLAFDGDDSSFTGNTNMDLSFDGNTAIDLSFVGNTNLDLGVDGEESGADGEYFYIVKPKTKILVKDKKTGIVHNSKHKLGKGSKVKGKVVKGVHKFRAKSKKTGTVSTINKASGYVIIGENDLAQMLVPVGSIRPLNMSSFSGNTNLDLGFAGNTNLDLGFAGNTNLDLGFNGNTTLDLSVDGSRPKLTPEQRAERRAKRRAKMLARRASGKGHGRGGKRKHGKRHSSLTGNTGLDLSFNGNTNLDLSVEGGEVKKRHHGKHRGHGRGHGKHKGGHRKHAEKVAAFSGNTNLDLNFNGGFNKTLQREMKVNLNHRLTDGIDGDDGIDGNTNLDLSFDGAAMKRHFRERPQLDNVQNGLDLGFTGNHASHTQGVRIGSSSHGHHSFNGGALERDFNGGGDMLYFDGSDEMSNAIGSWIKGIKAKAATNKAERKEKKEANKITKEAEKKQKADAKAKEKAMSKENAAVLADKNKVVFTEDEMVDIYKSSGSSRPFSEWTKSEGAKNFFNSITQFGAAFLQKKSQEAAGVTPDDNSGGSSDDNSGGGNGGSPTGEKTILGMHPVTFTIVAVGVGLLAIGGIYLASRGKGTPTPSIVPVG